MPIFWAGMIDIKLEVMDRFDYLDKLDTKYCRIQRLYTGRSQNTKIMIMPPDQLIKLSNWDTISRKIVMTNTEGNIFALINYLQSLIVINQFF